MTRNDPLTDIVSVASQYNIELKNKSNSRELVYICPRTGKEFYINPAKNTANCFRGCRNCPLSSVSGGVLGIVLLAGEYSGSPEEQRKAAYKDLATNSNTVNYIIPAHSQPKEIKNTQIASDRDLDRAYTEFLLLLHLAEEDKKDLLKRGLDMPTILKIGFRTCPLDTDRQRIVDSLVSIGVNLEGVPGFFKTEYGYKMVKCSKGYFTPYRNKDGLIVRLQIRKRINCEGLTDEELRKRKSNRYRWFTSAYNENGTKCPSRVFYPPESLNYKNADTVCITEGGIKATVRQHLLNRYFVRLPGVGMFKLFRELITELKAKGFTRYIDCFDSDRASNPAVMDAINKMKSIAKEEDVEFESFDFGTEYKGIDDWALARKSEKANTHFNVK